MFYFIILICSFLLNYFLLFFLFYNKSYLNILLPNYNKIPFFSGITLFLSLSLIFLILSFQIKFDEYFYLIFSSLILIFIKGFIDDRIKINTYIKIFIQLVLSIFIIYNLDLNQILVFPLITNEILNFIFIVMFILGITNSINLIDGIDNLAALLSIIISFSFIVISFLISYQDLNFIFFIIIGSMLAHFVYNNFVSRVFLGDSGSLVLGWMFSTVSLIFMKKATFFSIHIPLLIIAIPAFDIIYLMIHRFLKQNNPRYSLKIKSMFIGDFNHIHHNLKYLKFSNNSICMIISSISICFSILSIIIFLFIEHSLYKSLILFFLLLSYIMVRVQINKFS